MSKENEAMALAKHAKADEIGRLAKAIHPTMAILVGEDSGGWNVTTSKGDDHKVLWRVVELKTGIRLVPWESPHPYADIFVEFQDVLGEYGKACMALVEKKVVLDHYRDEHNSTPENDKELEDARMVVHHAKLQCQIKFNDVLSKYQDLKEGRVTRRGTPRQKRCCFCGCLEDATKAHRVTQGGARKWTCDGCWDERLRD